MNVFAYDFSSAKGKAKCEIVLVEMSSHRDDAQFGQVCIYNKSWDNMGCIVSNKGIFIELDIRKAILGMKPPIIARK